MGCYPITVFGFGACMYMGRTHLDRVHVSFQSRDDPLSNFVVILRFLVGVLPDRVLSPKLFHLRLERIRAGDSRMEYTCGDDEYV